MYISVSILCHSRIIQKNLPRFDATASIDFDGFVLNVFGRNRYYRFTPQFLRKENGRMKYTPTLPDDPRGFVGWLPYFNKRWDVALDKLAFKRYCLGNGLSFPAFSTDKADALPGFLVKRRQSSFGEGIRGPFRRFDPSNAAHRLRENEYYDQFIPGRMGKAWYWNDKPVCCELREMPGMAGDGTHTLRQLIEAQLGKYGFTPEWEDFEDTLEFHGSSLDDVPGNGRHVTADFRFGSLLLSPDWLDHNVLPRYLESKLGEQLRTAGPVLWKAIPGEIRQSTLYTVDFIVDEQERVWFLEMNCNPLMHPDVYPHIFEDLFGPPKNLPVQPVRSAQPVSMGGVPTVPPRFNPPAPPFNQPFAPPRMP
jgi:hypothetical protein